MSGSVSARLRLVSSASPDAMVAHCEAAAREIAVATRALALRRPVTLVLRAEGNRNDSQFLIAVGEATRQVLHWTKIRVSRADYSSPGSFAKALVESIYSTVIASDAAASLTTRIAPSQDSLDRVGLPAALHRFAPRPRIRRLLTELLDRPWSDASFSRSMDLIELALPEQASPTGGLVLVVEDLKAQMAYELAALRRVRKKLSRRFGLVLIVRQPATVDDTSDSIGFDREHAATHRDPGASGMRSDLLIVPPEPSYELFRNEFVATLFDQCGLGSVISESDEAKTDEWIDLVADVTWPDFDRARRLLNRAVAKIRLTERELRIARQRNVDIGVTAESNKVVGLVLFEVLLEYLFPDAYGAARRDASGRREILAGQKKSVVDVLRSPSGLAKGVELLTARVFGGKVPLAAPFSMQELDFYLSLNIPSAGISHAATDAADRLLGAGSATGPIIGLDETSQAVQGRRKNFVAIAERLVAATAGFGTGARSAGIDRRMQSTQLNKLRQWIDLLRQDLYERRITAKEVLEILRQFLSVKSIETVDSHLLERVCTLYVDAVFRSEDTSPGDTVSELARKFAKRPRVLCAIHLRKGRLYLLEENRTAAAGAAEECRLIAGRDLESHAGTEHSVPLTDLQRDAGRLLDAAKKEPDDSNRVNVFISFKDKGQQEEHYYAGLLAERLERQEVNVFYSDWNEPGLLWDDKIDNAVRGADIGVIFVSRRYLESSFVRERELLPFIDAAEKKELQIGWLLWEEIQFEDDSWFAEDQTAKAAARQLYDRLEQIQALNKTKDPMWTRDDAARSALIDDFESLILGWAQQIGDRPLAGGSAPVPE